MLETEHQSNLENTLYTSALDRQVRLYSPDQKAQLHILNNTLDNLIKKAETDPFGSSQFCIDHNQGYIRDQTMFNVERHTFTYNAKPASEIQIRDLLEKSGYYIDISEVILPSDDDLSRRAHENYVNTAAAWTDEADNHFKENSLQFMHDINEVEKLSIESGLDLSSMGARKLRQDFFKKLRNNARQMTNELADEVETEKKVIKILADINIITMEKDPTISEEYVKRVYPVIVEFIQQKYLALTNRKDNLSDRLMVSVKKLAEFSHRDISALMQELEILEELERQQIEQQVINDARKPFWKRLPIDWDLSLNLSGERGD